MYAFPNTPNSACTQAFAHALGLSGSLCRSFRQSLCRKLLLAQAVFLFFLCGSAGALRVVVVPLTERVCHGHHQPRAQPRGYTIIICQLNFRRGASGPETQGVGPGQHCVLQDGTAALPAQGRHSTCHDIYNIACGSSFFVCSLWKTFRFAQEAGE